MTPESFEEQLNVRCNTGARPYRVRWSDASQTWNVEQKIARSTEVPTGGDPDMLVRAQDGYGLVLQFSPSPQMRCPECQSQLDVPIMTTGEVRCQFCADHPDLYERKMWFTGYFPFCEKLIAYLERTAPKQGDTWVTQMTKHNDDIIKASKAAYANSAEAIAGDYWKQLAQIQQVGYGKGPASFGVL